MDLNIPCNSSSHNKGGVITKVKLKRVSISYKNKAADRLRDST